MLKKTIRIFLLSILGALIVIYFFCVMPTQPTLEENVRMSLERQAAIELQRIEDQVAVDSVNQYNIAKRQGDPIQICVQAGMAAAAYLQAKDEANYRRWKAIEKADCEAAGLVQ
jgi:hypothetical protein